MTSSSLDKAYWSSSTGSGIVSSLVSPTDAASSGVNARVSIYEMVATALKAIRDPTSTSSVAELDCLFLALEYASDEILIHMIGVDFYLDLAKLETQSDTSIIRVQTKYFKQLISFLLQTHYNFAQLGLPLLAKISTVFDVYLLSFGDYNRLVGYQRLHLKHLVANIISILQRNTFLLDMWQRGHPTRFLVYFAVRDLVFIHKQDSLSDLKRLIGLSSSNDQLSEWLVRYSGIALAFTSEFHASLTIALSLAGEPQTQLSIQSEVSMLPFRQFLKLFISVLQVASEQVAQYLFDEFERDFLNRLLDSTLNWYSLSFLSIVLSELTPEFSKYFDKILHNGHLESYLSSAIQSSVEPQAILPILADLMKFSNMPVLLFFGKPPNQTVFYDSLGDCVMDDLKVKAMNISHQSAQEVSEQFHYFTSYHACHLQHFEFNPSAKLSKVILLFWFNFFTSSDQHNKILIELTLKILLKMNLYKSYKFRMVLNHLYTSYLKYEQLIRNQRLLGESPQNRSQNLKFELLTPNQSFFEELNVPEITQLHIANSHSSHVLDQDETTQKMLLFKTFYLEVYVNCKWRSVKIQNMMLQRIS